MPILVSNDILTELVTKAACPRCGYGLRGIVESWTDACPLTGICSECGLEIVWRELLNPRRAVPRWCVEYGRRRSIPISAIKTVLVMFFRPRKFWRDLKMVHKPRWGRFSALVLLMLFLMYFVFASSTGFNTYKEFQSLKQSSISTPFHPAVYGLYATLNPFSNYQFKYTQTWRSGNTYTSRTRSPRQIAIIPRLAYFGGEVCGQIRNGKFINPFRGKLRTSSVIVQGMMLVTLCPLAFMALPQSLRKAKVRWQHLFRIALYSSLIIIPLMGWYIHSQIFRLRSVTYSSWQLQVWIMRGSLIYVLTGMIIWWSLAAKHYLKLPHAWGVGAAMVVLAYASGLFLVSLIHYLLF